MFQIEALLHLVSVKKGVWNGSTVVRDNVRSSVKKKVWPRGTSPGRQTSVGGLIVWAVNARNPWITTKAPTCKTHVIGLVEYEIQQGGLGGGQRVEQPLIVSLAPAEAAVNYWSTPVVGGSRIFWMCGSIFYNLKGNQYEWAGSPWQPNAEISHSLMVPCKEINCCYGHRTKLQPARPHRLLSILDIVI